MFRTDDMIVLLHKLCKMNKCFVHFVCLHLHINWEYIQGKYVADKAHEINVYINPKSKHSYHFINIKHLKQHAKNANTCILTACDRF